MRFATKLTVLLALIFLALLIAPVYASIIVPNQGEYLGYENGTYTFLPAGTYSSVQRINDVWYVNGVVFTGGPTVFTITVTQVGGGTISPDTTTVNYGDSVTFTFTPNSGAGINALVIDGNVVSPASTYTFTDVTATHAVSVEWTAGGNQQLGTSGEPGKGGVFLASPTPSPTKTSVQKPSPTTYLTLDNITNAIAIVTVVGGVLGAHFKFKIFSKIKIPKL